MRDGQVVTRMYNDFTRLRWLGNNPSSPMELQVPAEVGRWVAVESRARLNTPGQSDGLNVLWIDGLFQTDRRDLDWIGSYTAHGINAVFLEAYWNRTSPVTQSRYFDEFVVSTKPIGPVYTSGNAELVRTSWEATEARTSWEVELAVRLEGDAPGTVEISRSETRQERRRRRPPVDVTVGEDVRGEVVWRSRTIPTGTLHVTVDRRSGQFTGAMAQRDRLDGGRTYFCRVRQQDPNGDWSPWSGWHQPFQTLK